jgi:hypothetical protein
MKKRYLYIFIFILTVSISCEKTDNRSSSSTGTGGSLARFTISSGHLYVVDGDELHTFSLQKPAEPEQVNALRLGFNNSVETIYPWKDKLFIGSKDALYTISISDPEHPVLEGIASHLRACDPVVANDNYAYVTVRTGSFCEGNINALYVYDVSAGIQLPVRVFEGDMNNPQGLALHNQYLYVCDGAAGLVVLDVHNGASPEKITTREGYTFFDCIATGGVLVCMVEKGMVLYDISTPADPKKLSEIIN